VFYFIILFFSFSFLFVCLVNFTLVALLVLLLLFERNRQVDQVKLTEPSACAMSSLKALLLDIFPEAIIGVLRVPSLPIGKFSSKYDVASAAEFFTRFFTPL